MELNLTSAVIATLISFTVSVIICPIAIPILKRIKFGQYVRDDGPQSHLSKAGTPTMGGIIIVLSFVVASLFYLQSNLEGLLLVLFVFSFSLIGVVDDYLKKIRKRSLGMRAYQKWFAQIAVAVSFVSYIYINPDFSTAISIPFTGGLHLELGIFYIPIISFIILGTVNGANFTDGMDGFASGVAVIIAAFFMFAALSLQSASLPMTGAFAGSLLGFLLFNSYPAKIFMGDTGSMAIGGFVAGIAVLLNMPIWLGIVALIYVIEVLSVIIQVTYFKKTGGKRFFKMAPIHHSFELSGWHETKITTMFCVITVILCLIGFLAL